MSYDYRPRANDPPSTPDAGSPGGDTAVEPKDFYAQDTDPGAVGAGSVWKDTGVLPYITWERNQANDGWNAIAERKVVGAVNEDASAATVAEASGTGTAVVSATATGTGAATTSANINAEDVDGASSAVASALSSGTGNATSGARATSSTGSASSSVAAIRDAGGEASIEVGVSAAGVPSIYVTGLPTVDPEDEGQLWNDTGILKVSAG